MAEKKKAAAKKPAAKKKAPVKKAPAKKAAPKNAPAAKKKPAPEIQCQAQVAGGEVQVIKGAKTVRELRNRLEIGGDYTATINQNPADDDEQIPNFGFVAFAQKVVGG